MQLAVAIGLLGALVGMTGCGSSSTSSAAKQTGTLTIPATLALSGPVTTSEAQGITLQNASSAAVNIQGISIGGTNASDFSEANTCGTQVAAGSSCSVTVSFVATVAGTYSATLSIATDSTTNGTATVALTGTATLAQLTVSPSSLSFPLSATGVSSAAQIVTLSNTGTMALTLGQIAISGSNANAFSDTTNCGTALAVGASCTASVSFDSATAGSDAATLTIPNSASTGGSTTVALSGTAAIPSLGLSPATLTFSTTSAGASSTAQTITLTNNGAVPVTLGAMSFTGASAGSYTDTTTCGATLAAAGTCTVSVTFTPTAGGTNAATLSIVDNTSAGVTTASVAGTGTIAPAISLSASTLTFTTAAESTSATQTVTVKNSGSAALNITGDTLSASSKSSFNVVSDTCAGTTVSAGATCTIGVSLTAFLATSYTGSISIASNAASSPSDITLSGTGTGTVTLTGGTSTSTDWAIDNGAITLHFNPAQFHIWGANLDGDANDLVDTTYRSSKDGNPMGFYMGNQGLGAGTFYTGSQQGNGYLDVWAGETSSSTNFLTYEMHILVTANDPGYHTYYVVKHGASDIAGSLSLVLWQFRTNLDLFTHSYNVDAGLNNLGAMDVTLPSPSDSGSTDPGRAVQNAATELSGFTDAPTTTFMTDTGRNFYTKYDYSTYEYLHKGQGTYGPNYGAWVVLPRADTIAGGPTKQDVDTLTDLIQQEMVGDHYDGHFGTHNADGLSYTLPAGTVATKMYGPIYVHFNKVNGTNTVTGAALSTPAAMYQDAMSWMPWFDMLYDNESTLTGDSYVQSSARGTVTIKMGGIPAGLPAHKAWAVLSDPATNMQYSFNGYQYWADISADGTATITGVVPGTNRLTAYVLGQWGEFRQDGVVVTANSTTAAAGTWVPENFGSTVFTIGTADRSAHEFLHGEDANGNDKRNFYGQFNYWADFAANQGAVNYYATATTTGGVTTPATNDLTKWNYIHWGAFGFNPGLYGNYWCNTTTDDTTDGYTCAIPTYVKSLPTATGTNGVTTPIPSWQVHFATPANLSSYSSGYVDLSVSVACAYGSYVVTLNGSQQEVWHYANESDCMIRSGLSGYTQWFVMQWPTSLLNPTIGGDNVLSIGMSGLGSSDDAWRLELSNTGANPTTTGWNDYTYVIGSGYPATGSVNSYGMYNNDAIDNP